MNKTLFTLVATVIATSSFAGTTLTASHWYQVETSGTYAADGSFWDPGLAAGKYQGFGALDFDASALAGSTVGSATISLTQSPYHGITGTFDIYAVADNTTSLAKGQTTITYDTTVTGGYSNQLGAATLVGSYTFTQGASGTNPIDTITVSSGLSALQSQIDSTNHDVRLIFVTPDTAYGSYIGATNGSLNGPQITFSPVPEPASMAALGLGLVGLVARKRRK